MQSNRRNFIKNIGLISIGVAVLPLDLMGNEVITKKTVTIAPNWVIEGGNNIRYIGPLHDDLMESNRITVLELHRALSNVTNIKDEYPSQRMTNEIIYLVGDYNIDDHTSEYLYNGSITQNYGKIVYSGMVAFGNVEKFDIIQEGEPITNDFWNKDNGLNNDGNGATHRFLLPTKIDGKSSKKLIFRSAKYYEFHEFKIDNPYIGNHGIALHNRLQI